MIQVKATAIALMSEVSNIYFFVEKIAFRSKHFGKHFSQDIFSFLFLYFSGRKAVPFKHILLLDVPLSTKGLQLFHKPFTVKISI